MKDDSMPCSMRTSERIDVWYKQLAFLLYGRIVLKAVGMVDRGCPYA